MSTNNPGIADDPFALLEQTAKRQAAEEKLLERVSTVKRRLVIGKTADAAFWATLALRLKTEPAWDLDTAATDGTTLKINPLFFDGLDDDERKAIVAHEVGHLASCHHTRIGSRDCSLWNIASDLIINPILAEGKFKLPAGRLMPGEGPYADIPRGLSTEETYERLRQKQQSQQPKPNKQDGGGGKGNGKGKGKGQPDPNEQPGPGNGDDPGRCGGVQAPGDGSPADLQQAEAEMKVAVAQARNAAKVRGQLSAGLERWIAEQLAPRVDWKEVLREFVSKQARNDYSWSRPNRRFIHLGLYLPGMRSEELGDVTLAVDTSGSIGEKELSVFAAEMQSILDCFLSAALTIVYHDHKVCHVQKWQASDGPLKLEPKGGGGTSHVPVFNWIAQQGEAPTCLVCLTDMCSEFPRQAPNYPVLWASTVKGMKAPFGQLVEVVIS